MVLVRIELVGVMLGRVWGIVGVVAALGSVVGLQAPSNAAASE